MKYTVVILFAFTVISCRNSGQTISNPVIKSTCSTLLDSILFNYSNVVDVFFNQDEIRKNGIRLPDSIKRVLFSDTEIQKQMFENDCYLYYIVKSSDNIYSMVTSLTGLTEDGVYIINMNCDRQLTDYLRFEYCNYFDAYTPIGQNYEQALFLRKDFKYPNDTTFITCHINREEKKEFQAMAPKEKFTDSLTFFYTINKNGRFNLNSKDSIRIFFVPPR
jgi:hypothetical protein